MSPLRHNNQLRVFWLGGLIGLIVFIFIYGLGVVNPTNTDWIWHGLTHDTAQHYLGWQFYRADSTSGMINGLAYPHGLSMVYMDVIPLLAVIFRPLAHFLPDNFQYFGLWGLICYVLMGGLAAVLLQKTWHLVVGRRTSGYWQYLFCASGALVFTVSPVLLARSFYHPALAGQWLILLGFLLIIETIRFKKDRVWLAVWLASLVVAVLIHPYFLPMMGAMLALSVVRRWGKWSTPNWQRACKALAALVIPSLSALTVFYLIGGFSQGTAAEVFDLQDKGFNLLSFVNPAGYSLLPAFANRSSSPETMMWLGLGLWGAVISSAYLWHGHYKDSWASFRKFWRQRRGQCRAGLIVILALLIFAMGTRIDLGPIAIWQYTVPRNLYMVWSAFRAAAREAWPFYYALMFAVICWLSSSVKRLKLNGNKLPIILSCSLLLVAGLQSVDILASHAATDKRIGFKEITDQTAEFKPLDLTAIAMKKKHLVALDEDFRGDQTGTYVIGRTALRYQLTMGSGFFARVPKAISLEQASWRRRLINGRLNQGESTDYLFFTKNATLADQLTAHYRTMVVDGYTFIYALK